MSAATGRRRHARGRRVLVVVAWAVLVSGCPGRGLLAEERAAEAVRVEALEARFAPGDTGEFQLELSVENPGFQAGALTQLQWEVWLENRWFATGTQQLAEPLPAEGRHRFTLRLPVVFRRAVPAVEAPTSIEVGVRGGIVVQSSGGTQRLPFQARQRLNIANAPQFSTDADES